MALRSHLRSVCFGFFASAALLVLYFTVLSLISGWGYTLDQFSQFGYFVVALAVGFGVQIGLYTYLRELVRYGSGAMLGMTGTASTAAMLSCCTHYLANVLPILGVAGLVTFVAQYQVELFWAGIAFNLAGIAYMLKRVYAFKRAHI